ncbi:MAG: 23S rRNA pseudouridine955/2504/2580 synthase [Gammaproteobacteria bacterium]|jgi:23S rRNA pseudouridine955/2504/2580 synthase
MYVYRETNKIMSKTGAITHEIGVNENGRRLDNFLTGFLKNVPKSFIYRIIRRGEVRVNGSRSRPHRKLVTADRVRIPPMTIVEQGDQVIGAQKLEQISRSIIFENDSTLVINKPAGFAVHAGSGLLFGVIDIVRRLRPNDPEIELVHRIDRDTSGCLLLAKNYPALRHLQNQIADPSSEKTYLSLLHGELSEPTLDVDLRLSTIRIGGEKKTIPAADGKEAHTCFTTIEKFSGMTLAQARITTGRTHQIRAHAAAIGNPVIGDKKYAAAAQQDMARDLGLRRMFLHASSLTIKTSTDEPAVRIEAPLSSDLEELLRALRCQ